MITEINGYFIFVLINWSDRFLVFPGLSLFVLSLKLLKNRHAFSNLILSLLFISKSIAFTAEVTFDSSEVEELCLDIEGIQKVDNNDEQDIVLEESEVSADTSLCSVRAKNTTAIEGIASCAKIKEGHGEHYYKVGSAEHDVE